MTSTQIAEHAATFSGVTAAMAGSIAIAVSVSCINLTVEDAVRIARTLPRVTATAILAQMRERLREAD